MLLLPNSRSHHTFISNHWSQVEPVQNIELYQESTSSSKIYEEETLRRECAFLHIHGKLQVHVSWLGRMAHKSRCHICWTASEDLYLCLWGHREVSRSLGYKFLQNLTIQKNISRNSRLRPYRFVKHILSGGLFVSFSFVCLCFFSPHYFNDGKKIHFWFR